MAETAADRYEVRQIRRPRRHRLGAWMKTAVFAVMSEGTYASGSGRRWEIVDRESGEVVGTVDETSSDTVDVGVLLTTDLAERSPDDFARTWIRSQGPG